MLYYKFNQYKYFKRIWFKHLNFYYFKVSFSKSCNKLVIFYHYAHNTGNSLYPLLVSIHLYGLLSCFLLWFLGELRVFLFYIFLSLLLLLIVWGKDVIHEGLLGYHNIFIQGGLKLRFLFFLFREVIFFISIFWSYFDAVLVPGVELGGIWPTFGVLSPHYIGFPFLNTLLLVRRGVSVTWCHTNLLINNNPLFRLSSTIVLALVFLFVQWYEYNSLGFSMRDRVYGSIFFFGTGFHGFHVILGTVFLSYGLFWIKINFYSYLTHLSLECAILYWHFVDVVWLFLYLFVYWWGN